MQRVKTALRTPVLIHRAILSALQHDCLNLAQSSAYSALVSLFPALIVTAAAISLLPDTAPLRDQVGEFFDRVLPASVFPLLTSYFVTSSPSPHTGRALILASIVSLTGASSIFASLMEGIARANHLDRILAVSDGTHLFRIHVVCAALGLNVVTSARVEARRLSFWDAAERLMHEMISYTLWRLKVH